MAASRVQIKIHGVDELLRKLDGLPKALRRRWLRKAVRAAAKEIQGDAIDRAPVLKEPVKYRVPGLLKRKITVQHSKIDSRKGMVGVFVTVKRRKKVSNIKAKIRTLKKGSRLYMAYKHDPFYFKFQELGTKHHRAQPFLGPALNAKHGEAVAAFRASLAPEIFALNRGAPL